MSFALPSEAILAQLPGFILWKDLDLRILACNDKVAKLTGFASSDQLIGISDYDIKCGAVMHADVFRQQDLQVIRQRAEKVILDIHPYADGRLHLLLTRKVPFYDDKHENIIGVVSSSMFIDHPSFMRFILQEKALSKKYQQKQASDGTSLQLVKAFDFASLTEIESEVLYYFIREKTQSEIGLILKRPSKEIDAHIAMIKSKLSINSQAELISCCIENGLLEFMPISLLPHNYNFSMEIAHDPY